MADIKNEDAKVEVIETGIPYFPHEVVRTIFIACVVVAIIFFLAASYPVSLVERSNPLNTPEHLLPDWYFLFMYGWIKVAPSITIFGYEIVSAALMGLVLPTVGAAMLFALPFLDTKNPKTRPRDRPFMTALGIITKVIIVVLSYLSIVIV